MNPNDLRDLVESFVDGRLSVQDFCNAFERAWNFEVERADFTAEQRQALEQLFDGVVLFSPLPRESWGYPKYRDANEILHVAQDALRGLAKRGALPKR